jgi:hypothetical protein
MYRYYDIEDKVYNVLLRFRQGGETDPNTEDIIADAVRAEFSDWADSLNSYQERALERDERS